MTVETIGELFLLILMIITACIVLFFIIWLLVIWILQGGDREIAGLFLMLLVPILIVCVISILFMLGIDILASVKAFFDTPL